MDYIRWWFDYCVGKYYIVNSDYANTDSFLAIFRSFLYHTHDVQRIGRPISSKELFNFSHSSLQNCIKDIFRGIVRKIPYT